MAKIDMDTTQYEIRFKNLTPTSCYFAVYRGSLTAPALKPTAWKVVGIPPTGVATTQWTMDFGVAIANWQMGPPGLYTEQQIVPAKLGKCYSIIQSPDDSDIPMIDPKPVKDLGEADLIKLTNTTSRVMNAGVALDGSLFAVLEGLGGGESMIYASQPTYVVATYYKCKQGMKADEGVPLATPITVVFKPGTTAMQVEAVMDGESQNLVASPILAKDEF